LVHAIAVRASFDHEGLLAYLAARAIPGVEAVTAEGSYCRTLRVDGRGGWISVRAGGGARRPTLRVEVSPSLGPARAQVVERVRRLFDLDADGDAVSAHLARDPAMAPLVARRPGLRLPGTMDRFELAVRAVLGQQVSVAGANTLAGRLVRLVGTRISRHDGEVPPTITHLPVAAERLAAARPATIAGIGIPRVRAACLVSLARAVADGQLPELAGEGPVPEPEGFIRRFTALPGIGAWTAEYVAMRALGWRDAFPAGDLGLRKAMGGITEVALRGAAERWRPWRAYAAQHLWASLGDGKNGNTR
jgi:AraC family transcriptional regulator of adaptative response / DNA-3-methyladenine glycosylase II